MSLYADSPYFNVYNHQQAYLRRQRENRHRELTLIRRTAREFLFEHGLSKTARVVANHCYGDVFESATKELGRGNEKQGLRKMVTLLRQSGNVDWIERFWFHLRGTRMQHLDYRFRCEIWTKLAWMAIRSKNKEFTKSVFDDLSNPLSPNNLLDNGYFSDTFRTALKSAVA